MTFVKFAIIALPLLVALAGAPAQASFARSSDTSVREAPDTAGQSSAVTRATAVGAGERAKIALNRAVAGSDQYNPTTICETNINNTAQYTGNVTILAGGFCPSNMRNR